MPFEDPQTDGPRSSRPCSHACSDLTCPVPSIRNLALGLALRESHVLASHGADPATGRRFYRALGGGIEFGESAEAAVRREFLEELGVELEQVQLVGVLENFFEWDSHPGHEIVHVFEVSSSHIDELPLDAQLTVLDTGDAVTWIPLDSERPIDPAGVLDLVPRR